MKAKSYSLNHPYNGNCVPQMQIVMWVAWEQQQQGRQHPEQSWNRLSYESYIIVVYNTTSIV